jgi:release factor glutamine methyltransferase
LEQDRTWLIAHGSDDFDDANLRHTANTMLTKRMHRMPLAYLVGRREFYGRDFIVSPDVLIPRPETETMITLLGKYHPRGKLIDVGCGSGCIGLTAKLEHPELDVTLSDISSSALDVARRNAESLEASVDFRISDLLASFEATATKFNFILANLPYVDSEWERSPETDHEPSLALFADDHGLALIKTLISQAASLLNTGGYLLLEADPVQHDEIQKTGDSHGLRFIESNDYMVVLARD